MTTETDPIWKKPRTRYHYLHAREQMARSRGFLEGVAEAAAYLRRLACEAFLDHLDEDARLLRSLAADLRADLDPEAPEEPPADVIDDAVEILQADTTEVLVP